MSEYNYDFALAALPIQIMLLLFYSFRRNLPIRSSRSFLWVMLANLIMTAFDIISCEMNVIWDQYPLWLMYAVNCAYFIGFVLRGWALFDYTAEECGAYMKFGRLSRPAAWIPAALMTLLIVTTGWTGAIFRFSADTGYYNCSLYPSIYYISYFYIILSLISVAATWKETLSRLKVVMLGYNAVLIAGIILRGRFINTLVTSYFSIIAVLMVYLSAQNPDLFREWKTQLFNREAFDRICTEFHRNNRPFRCIIATIHNFESAKSLYGSQQMNRCIKLIGQWMIQSFPQDYVFYFGNGDYILLEKADEKDKCENVVGRIYERFSRPWQEKETDAALSVSAMVLPYELIPRDIPELDDLIAFAFARARSENVRGNVVFTTDAKTQLARRKAVEQALGQALLEQRIEAYYQPIYSTAEQRVTGAEALARLYDPGLGMIPPEEFIHIAEQTGDIMELGWQMFENVCRFLATGEPSKAGIRRVSVNLSPAQCMSDQLAEILISIAEKHHVDLSLIEFEITESSISNPMLILQQMQILQKKGAAFSLDDFGTGNSNVTRLMKLPIERVKLDMTVVHSYFKGESGLLPDLVHMFRNAEKKVVVEGIETRGMKEKLSRMGCDYLQGYYFSKAVPAERFMEYLRKANQTEKSGIQ